MDIKLFGPPAERPDGLYVRAVDAYGDIRGLHEDSNRATAEIMRGGVYIGKPIRGCWHRNALLLASNDLRRVIDILRCYGESRHSDLGLADALALYRRVDEKAYSTNAAGHRYARTDPPHIREYAFIDELDGETAGVRLAAALRDSRKSYVIEKNGGKGDLVRGCWLNDIADWLGGEAMAAVYAHMEAEGIGGITASSAVLIEDHGWPPNG